MTRKLLRSLAAAAAITVGLILSACGPQGPSQIQTASLPVQPQTATGKVALLLPYGDGSQRDLTVLAESLENSARLALNDRAADGITLQVYPTQGSVEGAATAARSAIADGAAVIVGPLRAAAAVEVAAVAADRGVPVLSFSNNPTITGSNLYALGYTSANSAERIIRYAVASGRRQVLAVHAVNPQGQLGNAAIRNAADASRIEPPVSVSYEFSQKGVVDSIPTIVSAADAAQADVIVFTADTAGALSLLGQLLPEAGIDTEQVRFTGLTRWDIPESNLANEGLQGGWFPLPDPDLSASFNHRYRYEFGEAPHPLASLAYDGMIAAQAMLSSRSGRADSAMLRSPDGFIGPYGPFRFRADGQIERSLAIAEVRNNRTLIISDAPRNFALPAS